MLDLVDRSRADEEVVGLILRACQRRLTTPARLWAAARRRRRLRRRPLVIELLAEARAGAASPLELRYRRDVERAHGLPHSDRGQSWIGPDGRRRYFDVRYRRWRLRIELEGLAYHPLDRSQVDHDRDNAAVLTGDVVLRYGWSGVVGRPCGTAAQIGALLSLRGWPGQPRRCGATCSISPQ